MPPPQPVPPRTANPQMQNILESLPGRDQGPSVQISPSADSTLQPYQQPTGLQALDVQGQGGQLAGPRLGTSPERLLMARQQPLAALPHPGRLSPPSQQAVPQSAPMQAPLGQTGATQIGESEGGLVNEAGILAPAVLPSTPTDQIAFLLLLRYALEVKGAELLLSPATEGNQLLLVSLQQQIAAVNRALVPLQEAVNRLVAQLAAENDRVGCWLRRTLMRYCVLVQCLCLCVSVLVGHLFSASSWY